MITLVTTILSLLQVLRAAPLRLLQRYRHRRLVRAARRRRKERIGELYHKAWKLENEAFGFRCDVNELELRVDEAKERLDILNTGLKSVNSLNRERAA